MPISKIDLASETTPERNKTFRIPLCLTYAPPADVTACLPAKIKAYVNFGSFLIGGYGNLRISSHLGKLRLSGDGTDKKVDTQISVYDEMRWLDDSAHARAGVMKTNMVS